MTPPVSAACPGRLRSLALSQVCSRGGAARTLIRGSQGWGPHLKEMWSWPSWSVSQGSAATSWVCFSFPLEQWPPSCSEELPKTSARDLTALPPQLFQLPHPSSAHSPPQCSGRNLGVRVTPTCDCQHVLPLLWDLPPQHTSHVPMSQSCHLHRSSCFSRCGPRTSGVGFRELVRNTEALVAAPQTSQVRLHVTPVHGPP